MRTCVVVRGRYYVDTFTGEPLNRELDPEIKIQYALQ